MADIEPALSKYFHQKGIVRGIPVSGTFELTRKCNFNCKMCYIHCCDTSKDNELTADQWISIAEKARDMGMLFLLLTGGEPLIRPDFPEIYERLQKLGFVISINSDGSLIDGEIFELLKKYPPCRINISLYGGSRETYENLCGNGQFDIVAENIKKLKGVGITVKINSVFNKYNVSDADRIFDIARELDIAVRPASYMYPPVRAGGSTGCNGARLTPKEAAACNIKCKKLMYSRESLENQVGEMMKIDSSECDDDNVEGSGVRCRAGRSSFWVTFDGKMTPCGMMPEPFVSLKDVPFDKAWEKIRQMTSEIRLPKECQSCKLKDICSVCAAMCYTETGSFGGKPEYICSMMEEIVNYSKAEFVKGGGENEG
ncbi:MAG: radical SAM protein [Clostridiales bacterium]|nr:radical SAM protein [Clostridiales bacterium]